MACDEMYNLKRNRLLALNDTNKRTFQSATSALGGGLLYILHCITQLYDTILMAEIAMKWS